MSESIKTGGIGKNPAIDKVNSINEIASRIQAARKLEKLVFDSEKSKMEARKRKEIVKDFHIHF